MEFQHKKKGYENIFRWNEQEEGSCFYCKEDKKIEMELINEKGICIDCLKTFEIGHVGTDRHVIEKIMPGFKSYKEVVKWFEEKGVKMIFKTKIEDTYIYDAINNEAIYKEHQNHMRNNGIAAINQEILSSYNSVEISEDGESIHIIY